jgi:hypothetical protein
LHTKQTRTRSSCSKQGKLEGPVSSGPAAVRGTVDSDEGVLLPAKWHLTRGGTRSITTEGFVVVASRSKRRENEKERKLRQNVEEK